jgi:hypothetical protein
VPTRRRHPANPACTQYRDAEKCVRVSWLPWSPLPVALERPLPSAAANAIGNGRQRRQASSLRRAGQLRALLADAVAGRSSAFDPELGIRQRQRVRKNEPDVHLQTEQSHRGPQCKQTIANFIFGAARASELDQTQPRLLPLRNGEGGTFANVQPTSPRSVLDREDATQDVAAHVLHRGGCWVVHKHKMPLLRATGSSGLLCPEWKHAHRQVSMCVGSLFP